MGKRKEGVSLLQLSSFFTSIFPLFSQKRQKVRLQKNLRTVFCTGTLYPGPSLFARHAEILLQVERPLYKNLRILSVEENNLRPRVVSWTLVRSRQLWLWTLWQNPVWTPTSDHGHVRGNGHRRAIPNTAMRFSAWPSFVRLLVVLSFFGCSLRPQNLYTAEHLSYWKWPLPRDIPKSGHLQSPECAFTVLFPPHPDGALP